MEEGRLQEGPGADHYSGYPQVLETHRVVHTARGTGPSISYRRDYEVATLRQRIDDVLRCGPGVNKFVQYHRISELKSLFQLLPESTQ